MQIEVIYICPSCEYEDKIVITEGQEESTVTCPNCEEEMIYKETRD